MTEKTASVDTDLHPYFRIYSAGNFGEVAPQRLSPMSWSLVGDPMERGTRKLAQRLWGRPAWTEGSHYVFVGYFGCRPYHNLAAYCHLSRGIPGLSANDVTDAYFEGIDSPAEITALRSGRTRRLSAATRLLRELRDIGPRLRALEERVAELEWALRAATTANSPIALFSVLRDAKPVLEEAWAVHILTTSGCVPIRALQQRVYGRLARHGDEIAHWLTRPRELVWDRLHTAAATMDPFGPGDFLDSSFYEVADSSDPWQDYAVRHKLAANSGTQAAVAPIEPSEALAGMLSPWRSRTVRSLAVAVGEVMAGREHSKSLAMRTLHIYRRLLPELAGSLGVDPGHWPYLTIREFTDLATDPGLAARALPRIAACRVALGTPMPEHLDLSDGDGTIRPWLSESPQTHRGVAPGIGVGVAMTPDGELPDEPVIIVCSSADADIAPLLPFAEGVLSERGSDLSHIAILAREYGIPCVVGYPGAASLPAGTAVSINGSTGEVNILDQS
ncbi:PEP-utilizing enzyme [Streptomyces johnsoniae]|uniref:PEP-utilizing enzyme n=1 Tax=Streptomyces johnsoniae TaxID=3075532 RepID=A0ABU2S1F4_9ACTN|nr:PEP-utilizing enzyme [Streptomyces sp. DSM 41886]MDT0442531.1 PEP-utilizing enzyme [Streptomyces sp. DSM 41886]